MNVPHTKEKWMELFDWVGEKEMIIFTEWQDSHPEGYDGPCLCGLCRSYGDAPGMYNFLKEIDSKK